MERYCLLIAWLTSNHSDSLNEWQTPRREVGTGANLTRRASLSCLEILLGISVLHMLHEGEAVVIIPAMHK
ncbi:hypothetical protein PM082_021395 [Marasmius tenuissimus]|nr:hypothetical protein PM082_021395 [Marasmius tenuissimus]